MEHSLHTFLLTLTFGRAGFRSEGETSSVFSRSISVLMVCFALLCAGCQGGGAHDDGRARSLLASARQLMSSGNYAGARDSIVTLRRECPMALGVRREAIVTLDSVELLAARDSAAVLEWELDSARAVLERTLPRIDGRTNDEYYAVQRRVYALEQRYDELCAKVKFFLRKIDIDKEGNS